MLAGFLVQKFGGTSTYVCSFPSAILVLVPLCLGWYGERRCTEADTLKMRERICERSEICYLALLIAVIGIVTSVVAVASANSLVSSVMLTCMLVVLLLGFGFSFSTTVSSFFIYNLIDCAFDLQISGAAYYFYTDGVEQFPEGPHFSPFFFVTVSHCISYASGLIGTLIYVRYLSSCTYRDVLAVAVVWRAICRAANVLFFSFVSRRLGIPDRLFVAADEAMGPIYTAWRQMPLSILLAHLCPKGMFATMSSLALGATYVGESTSKAVGAVLLEYFGCKPAGNLDESEEFDRLWAAALVATAVTTAVGLGLLWLIPNVPQDAPFHPEQETKYGAVPPKSS